MNGNDVNDVGWIKTKKNDVGWIRTKGNNVKQKEMIDLLLFAEIKPTGTMFQMNY